MLSSLMDTNDNSFLVGGVLADVSHGHVRGQQSVPRCLLKLGNQADSEDAGRRASTNHVCMSGANAKASSACRFVAHSLERSRRSATDERENTRH